MYKLAREEPITIAKLQPITDGQTPKPSPNYVNSGMFKQLNSSSCHFCCLPPCWGKLSELLPKSKNSPIHMSMIVQKIKVTKTHSLICQKNFRINKLILTGWS